MKSESIKSVFRILLGLVMVMAAIGHFTFQRQEFQAQVPNWLGNKDFVVIASGILELLLGVGIAFVKPFRIYFGIALAIFYVLIFPGNIAQYLNHTDAFGLNTDSARLIRLFFQPVLVAWALWSSGAWKFYLSKESKPNGITSFYDLEAEDIRGQKIAMSTYKGKYVLVVNTATKCGLAPQLEGLEQIHKDYSDKGVVVLGFPSNQFANQEPGGNAQIAESCAINYGVSFKMFSKIDVNGKDAHPIFKFLRFSLPDYLGDSIKWNFTKFIIDPTGKPIKRFAPKVKPEVVEEYLKNILNK